MIIIKGGTNWANAGRPNELARPPSPQPVAAPRNVNIFLVNPGNENNARQRRESIVSENKVSAYVIISSLVCKHPPPLITDQ